MSRSGTAASIIVAILCATLWWTGIGFSAALNGGDANLLRNGDFTSTDGGAPTDWTINAIPPCGFSFASHRGEKSGAAAGEFEIINHEPVESSLEQVLTLKPGWYRFTAEIKIETLGSAGAAPELFARSMTLPVTTRTHPMGFKSGWRKYQLSFKTGPSVREVAVGFALGAWGSPNTGRILLRNPVLLAADKPRSSLEITDLDKSDLQKLVDSRFGSPDAKDAFSPAKYPIGHRWTVAVVYAGFLMVALLGWWAVSPRRRI